MLQGGEELPENRNGVGLIPYPGVQRVVMQVSASCPEYFLKWENKEWGMVEDGEGREKGGGGKEEDCTGQRGGSGSPGSRCGGGGR